MQEPLHPLQPGLFVCGERENRIRIQFNPEHRHIHSPAQSPCCEKVYPCRLCHDDKETHTINRFDVKEVVCRECSCRQPVSVQCRSAQAPRTLSPVSDHDLFLQVASSCVKCLVLFARYYCSVCHLYDDVDKGQFHCEGCGICRCCTLIDMTLCNTSFLLFS